MYALFPAFVSSLFLFYGVYVVTTRGRTRASLAFLGMTTLTCLWQGIWAFLFQTHDIGTAQVLAKLGWIAILVMPTMLYHFAVEVAEAPSERPWLLAAYALDAALIALLLTTNLVIDGVHAFHFGFYPKAGVLEAVHIAQTVALVTRGMWVLYREQRHATAEKRKRLLTCLFGVGLISLAAADYAVNGLCQPPQHPAMLDRLSKLAGAITSEVASAHSVIEMALASVTLERLDRRTFAAHSLRECVETAVAQYPFQAGERERVHVEAFNADWRFVGSDTLLVYVLFNLLKNALHAIQIARKGHIEISARQDGDSYVLVVRDSATGIPPSVQRRIFDPFFSTKHVGKGSGVGLTFCRRVMQAFGGRIQCESVVGEYTLFSMRFPQPPAI